MKKVTGILVFTNQEVLAHKQDDGRYSEDMFCFWDMKRFPKQTFSRFYMAVKGKVQGYFKIRKEDLHEGRFHFDSDSWVEIKDGEVLKPSQGWRYYTHN